MSREEREKEIQHGAAGLLLSNIGKNRMQAHDVPWKKYVQMNMIDKAQHDAISAFDKLRGAEARSEVLLKDGRVIAETLVNMLLLDGGTVDKQDLMYILYMIDDMLDEDRGRTQLFRDLLNSGGPDPIHRLLNLSANSKPAGGICAHILAILHYPGLGYGEPLLDESLLQLVGFVRSNLCDDMDVKALKDQATTKSVIEMLSALMVILREERCRQYIIERYSKIPGQLSRLLKTATDVGNVQLLYQVGFCLWLLSYSDDIAEEMQNTSDVVINVLKVMKTVSKEKVIRVCLACLRNLVTKGTVATTLIENDAMKLLSVLASRKWSDEEVKEDIDFINDCLAQSVVVLSSLQMYSDELKSGQLEWSPVHKSETFWRDNVCKICPVTGGVEDGSGDLMLLIKFLFELSSKELDSQEKTTLAVVCHDLGEFSRFHPNGKRILQNDAQRNQVKHGKNKSSKDLIMQLMTSPPSEEVGKQALTCIHKMMVTNWQFLEGSKA
jgi:V-type H+-transporting ATPase subunit H